MVVGVLKNHATLTKAGISFFKKLVIFSLDMWWALTKYHGNVLKGKPQWFLHPCETLRVELYEDGAHAWLSLVGPLFP
jgi:hypothetical protein